MSIFRGVGECLGYGAIALAVLISNFADTAVAQTDIENIVRQQRQIIQEQERRRRERIEKLRNAPDIREREKRQRQSIEGKKGICLPIRKITFKGAELLNADRLAAKEIKKHFIGKCLSVVEIMTIVKVVTNWYIDKGYVTTRAYPPAQDLSKKKLIIKVIEGRTESLNIYENRLKRKGLDTAFPRIIGKRLFIRDVEQGLDQINRLATHDATIRIEPGEKEGFSRLRVDTKREWLGAINGVSIDNHGLLSTGRYQLGTNGTINDVFGLYSSLNLGYRTSQPFENDLNNWSSDYSAGLSVPLGYWTLFASGSYFEYESNVVSTLRALDGSESRSIIETSGETVSASLEIERVIHRDRLSKTRFSVFDNFKDTKSYQQGVLNSGLSRALNVVGARMAHSRRIFGGLMDVAVEGNWGAPLFGSETDETKDPNIRAVAEFSKVSANFGFFRPINLGKSRLALKLNGRAQYSGQQLFSSERIGIGGYGTVRGFRDDSISGDTGGYLRNELILTVPNYLPQKARKVIGDLDLFAAYDVGWLRKDLTKDSDYGTLSGFATGARLRSGILYGEVSYEKALERDSKFVEDEGDIFRFNAGMSLKW